MNQKELATKGTKHTHSRILLKSWDYTKTIHEAKASHGDSPPAEVLWSFIEEFNKVYKTTKAQTNYSLDEEGNTEYYKYAATARSAADYNVNYRLTVHVFSCYCEPLNENKEPPF